MEHDITVLASSQSPDGQHLAVAYKDMGGGAAGWCYVCVDVIPAKKTFTPKNARCEASQQWFRCSVEPALTWKDKTELVASQLGQPAVAPLKPRQAAKSAPQVHVLYSEP
jgi:hypothetical protein